MYGPYEHGISMYRLFLARTSVGIARCNGSARGSRILDHLKGLGKIKNDKNLESLYEPHESCF